MLVRHHITSSLGQHKLELKGSQLLKKWVEGGGRQLKEYLLNLLHISDVSRRLECSIISCVTSATKLI